MSGLARVVLSFVLCAGFTYALEVRYVWLSKAMTSCSMLPNMVPPGETVTFTALGKWRKEQKINGTWESVGEEFCDHTAEGTAWMWVCLPTEQRVQKSNENRNGMQCTFAQPTNISYKITIKPSGGGAKQYYKAPDGKKADSNIVTPGVEVTVTL